MTQPATKRLVTEAIAKSTYAPIRAAMRGNRIAFLGDSITIAQGNDDITGQSWGISYPTVATYLSKGRLVRVKNAGVSGNRAVDMLNRFDTDVTPFAPSLVAIMAGTNDWNDAGPTPLATYQQNIKDLVAKCRAISAQPILCTVPPNVISTARRQRVTTGNTWLRKYAAAEGIPLIDFYNLLVDPATGDYLTAYGSAVNDKTHPIGAGYAAMGAFFWNSLGLGTVSPVDALLPMENADPNNKLTNGLFLTTTGSGTSLMPTGWTVQTSVHPTGVTASLVTGDTAIKGNWWKLVSDGTQTATDNEWQTVSGIVPGHTYAHVGRFKATGMRNVDTGNGSTFLIGCAFNSVLNTTGYDFRTAQTIAFDVADGTFYQEMVAPSDASTALVRAQLIPTTNGGGTLQLAQRGLYDLTAMGLA